MRLFRLVSGGVRDIFKLSRSAQRRKRRPDPRRGASLRLEQLETRELLSVCYYREYWPGPWAAAG